jgi:hypothetical protein
MTASSGVERPEGSGRVLPNAGIIEPRELPSDEKLVPSAAIRCAGTCPSSQLKINFVASSARDLLEPGSGQNPPLERPRRHTGATLEIDDEGTQSRVRKCGVVAFFPLLELRGRGQLVLQIALPASCIFV